MAHREARQNLAPVPQRIDKGAEAAVKRFTDTLGDPKLFAASVSTRADTLMLGSDKGERWVGGAAVKAQLAKWKLGFEVHDGIQAGASAKGTVAWVAVGRSSAPQHRGMTYAPIITSSPHHDVPLRGDRRGRARDHRLCVASVGGRREYKPYTTDPRFTACVAAVLPTVDELRRFDVDDRPDQPGAGHGSAVEFVAKAYSHAAAEASQGRVRFRAP